MSDSTGMKRNHASESGSKGDRRGGGLVFNSLVSGSMAGIASTLACHPFDVLRTKMQASAMETSLLSNTAGSNPLLARGAGPIQVFTETFKNGGLRALYTGITLPLAAQAVYKATIFTVNSVAQRVLLEWKMQEQSQTTISKHLPTLSLWDKFFCGCIGGGANAFFFVTPVEFVRNHLIGQHSKSVAGHVIQKPASGPIDVIRHTIHSPQGLAGLWRGASVTVARDSIGCGCFFLAMEWSQQYFKKDDNAPPSLGLTIVSGALAGFAFWVWALPLDTAKTWVQSEMTNSALKCVGQSFKDQGVFVTIGYLLRGWQVAYTRGIPSAAITVTTYSLCYRTLDGAR